MISNTHAQGFAVVSPDEVKDSYQGSDVPGEFRRLGGALGCEQLAVTLIRVPPHSDFEQGTGHFHDKTEELYLLTRGTLTMRFGDEVKAVSAPARRTPASASSTRGGAAAQDLVDRARQIGIEGRSKMNKGELVNALRNH